MFFSLCFSVFVAVLSIDVKHISDMGKYAYTETLSVKKKILGLQYIFSVLSYLLILTEEICHHGKRKDETKGQPAYILVVNLFFSSRKEFVI